MLVFRNYDHYILLYVVNKQLVSWIINSVVLWILSFLIKITTPSDLRKLFFVFSMLNPLQNEKYLGLKSLPIHASEAIIIWHLSFSNAFKYSKSFMCLVKLLILMCSILRLLLCFDKFSFISLIQCKLVLSESKSSQILLIEAIFAWKTFTKV